MDKFPKRFAAIDMGTNSFHLIIAEVKEGGRLKILDREREFIRLGSEHENDLSLISEQETEKAIGVLKTFLSIANYHNAKIRAVSTSAVREAKNKNDFVEKIFKLTGIKVEVIKGTEEARLIFLGMRNALPINDKSVLGIDIGGGSAEFIHGVNGNPVFAESIKIGAVRLSKKFFPNFIITETSIKECSDYVEEQIKLNENINRHISFEFAVGSSGTIDTVCMLKQNQLVGKKKKKMNGYSFSNSEFDEIYNLIMNLKTSAERLKIPGIEAKRADIFPAGLIVLKKAFEIFHIKKMTLSDYALREGIVYDCINKNLQVL